MLNISPKNGIISETMSAIFIIVLVSLFILFNFLTGFILYLYILVIGIAGMIAFFHPRSGIYAIVFLTFIFERFFTLQPIVFGRAEYKLYPLDVIFLALILGIIFQILKIGLNPALSSAVSNIKEKNYSRDLSLFHFEKFSGKCGMKIKFNKSDILTAIFIILSAIYFLASVTSWHGDFELAFSSFKNYSFYPLFYFAILFLFQKKIYIRKLFHFVFAGAISIIFFIVYGIVTGQGLWSEFTPLSTEGVRLLAFTHSFYLSLAVLASVIYFIFRKEKANKAVLFLISIWIFSIVGSMMRHLWIGLAISIILIYFLISAEQKKVFKNTFIKFVSFAIIIFIIAGYFSLIFPKSEINNIFSSAANVLRQRTTSLVSVSGDESFFWRDVVWKESLSQYAENPIPGIGFGKKIYIEIDSYKDIVEVRNIHNSPLVILVQMGIISFGIFLAFIFINLKKIWAQRKMDWINLSLLILLFFYLTVFLFQPYLETNLLGIFFWILLGLIRSIKSPTYKSTRLDLRRVDARRANPLQIYK
jgi:O-antigen ligase